MVHCNGNVHVFLDYVILIYSSLSDRFDSGYQYNYELALFFWKQRPQEGILSVPGYNPEATDKLCAEVGGLTELTYV
jgi:hypothetical protein